MICDEFKISDALGIILFNPLKLGNAMLEKGRRLQEEDIVQLKKYGVEKVFGAVMEDGDISFQTALGIVGARLCGKNTAYSVGNDGVCRIISTIRGVFMVNDDRVAKFNRYNRNVILNIATPYAFVEENEIIAELELTLPLISQADVDELVFKLSGNVDMLSVHDVSSKRAGLIYTRFLNNGDETKHFTAVVKRLVKDFPQMNMNFVHEYETPHTVEDIAGTLQMSLKDHIDVLFVIGGQRNSCGRDILMRALQSFVDEIVCPSLPQVGASDLIIAAKKEKKVIVIPYNFDKLDTAYLERYIVQAIVADKLNVFDFNHPQNFIMKSRGRLDDERSERLIRSAGNETSEKEAGIAAVVLAAGVGARAGRNKLLAEVGGRPLFLNTLEAAVKSKASPVFLITGHQAEDMEEYLEDIDVNVIYNSAYRSGVRTSIDLGVKSVPGFCDGVILIPADMPNITPEYINEMIKSFQKGEGRQLVIASRHGIKCNPVIWGKDLYEFADVVPENADLRPVFIEHSDYTKLVEVKDENIVFDVNYPSDIETAQKAAIGKDNKP